MRSQCAHNARVTRSQCARNALTVRSQRARNALTVRSQRAHNALTMRALCAHNACTAQPCAPTARSLNNVRAHLSSTRFCCWGGGARTKPPLPCFGDPQLRASAQVRSQGAHNSSPAGGGVKGPSVFVHVRLRGIGAGCAH